jgi:MtN3 and saliva related transmembrane protein
MDTLIVLGLVAGALTTGSTVPQVLKILKTRSARDVSTLFFLLMAAGMLLWLVYGALRSDLVIVLWNAVSFCLCVTILALKRAYP